MDDPALRTITKRDPPTISKPTAVWTASVFFATGYLLLLVFVPDVRPGIIEAVLALAMGAAGGWFNTRMLPQFLTDLAIHSRSELWMDCGAFFLRSLPFEGSRARQKAFPIVWFGGFMSFALVFVILSSVLTHLNWPWVNSGDGDKFFTSMPSTMVPYMLLLIGANIRATHQWYNSLPD